MVVLGEVAVSYERGTPVTPAVSALCNETPGGVVFGFKEVLSGTQFQGTSRLGKW